MKAVALGSRSFSLGVLLSCLMAVALSSPALAADVELIVNGDFGAGQAPWWTAGPTAAMSGGVLTADVPASAVNPWEAIVGQSGIPLSSGATYTLRFDAWASAPANIKAVVQLGVDPYTAYFATDVALSTSPQSFSHTFTSGADDPAAAFQFLIGANGAYQASFDNVSLARPGTSAPPSRIGELLRNGTFSEGTTAPWWATSSASLAVADGRLEATITSGGVNPWDVIVGQSGIPVFAGGSYTLTLKAWASTNVVAHLSLQQTVPPYAEFFGSDLQLTTSPKVFTFSFTSAAEDPAASLQLTLGGQGEFVFLLDNASVNGPQPVSAMPIAQLVTSGGFDGAFAPWWTSNVSADVSGGFLQATIVNAGTNPWDAIVGQNGAPILAGGQYTLSFTAWASQDVTVRVLIQKNGPPYTGYFFSFIDLTTSPRTFSFTFASSLEDPAATLPITIRDVVAAAGVSVATVSRVLTGSVPVAADRRAAVLAAVERLHFSPSLAAQGLARGKSWEIGVLAQGIASSFYALMLAEIADGLRDSGYQPVFAEGSAELVIRALDTFVRRNVDALIVVGGQAPDRLLLDVAERIPLVAVARTIAGRESQCLQVSSVEGARAATRHLLELAHTRIAHVMGIPSHAHSSERLEGYRQVLAEAGLRPDPALIVTGDFEEPSGYDGVRTLFARRTRFSAVFAGNDQMAYGALLALHRRGLRVPEDVSLVGFDDQRGASFTTPPLTTVRQPAAQMGRAAAEGILRVLRGEPLALPVFSTQLIVRESTTRYRPVAARRTRRTKRSR